VDVPSIVERLRSDPSFSGSVVHWEFAPASAGSFADFPDWVHPAVRAAFRARGIERLFSHQREAAEAARAGEDTLVATPTASGKSLCYNLPVLDAIVRSKTETPDSPARALYLFPTKALSQDQVAELTELLGRLPVETCAFTYDGDTPPEVRRRLRDRGDVVVTNPYMLHEGILPNHPKWTDFFRGLRFVVVDEVHTLSGVFGSHVANVLRRLRRICAHYGSRPVFLGCSATIGNPGEHGERLFGAPVRVVDGDGSPRGERAYAFYNPPLLNAAAGLRASVVEEARRLAPLLAGEDHQTIFFAKSRSTAEVLVKYLKEGARGRGEDAEKIRSYRGGYLPELRRQVERDLRSGEVHTVVATNALELGIDVGSLDVAVLVGYPGSVASFFQQAGRAGRRGNASLAVLLCRASPDDQYLGGNPEYLFRARRERIAIDPDNLAILGNQMKCAAFELPFCRGEGFGDAPRAVVEETLDFFATEAGLLHREGDRYHWMAASYPAEDVSLDSTDMDNVVLLDAESRRAVCELDRAAALEQFHEGAVVGVQGETWVVDRFDYEGRRAYARKASTDYFTEAQVSREVAVLALEREERRGAFSLHRGEVHVTTVVPMFKKIRYYTRENCGAMELHLPPEEMDTEAFALVLAPEAAAAAGLLAGPRAGAWKGLGNLLRFASTLFVRCEPSDLGVVAEARSKRFEAPTITIYDNHPGGVGLSETAFAAAEDVLGAARSILEKCGCRSGCPACIGPPDEVGPAGKETALALLSSFLEAPALAG
jgi:DEAD/DEAH box helicase domain-containing protein